MKNLFITAIVLLCFTAVSRAQTQTGFSLSIKGAPQMSWLLNSDDKDNNALDIKPKFGVAFGLGAGYNFTENVGVELNALYSMQGRRYEVANGKFNQNVRYIKLAPVFVYTTPSMGITSFYGKIGPQINLLANSKLKNDDGDVIVDDMNKMYKKATFGGVANVGAQFGLSERMFLTTGVRYDIDFTNAEIGIGKINVVAKIIPNISMTEPRP